MRLWDSPHVCLLKTLILRFLWCLIPSPVPVYYPCVCTSNDVCVCVCVCVNECYRKSKALFPMRVIIPGWGGAGLPLHQRVFSSHTVVQAHGWPRLPLCETVCMCMCVREKERQTERLTKKRKRHTKKKRKKILSLLMKILLRPC